MPTLDLQAIVNAAPPVKAHKVPMPEMGGDVWVAELTANERDLRIDIGWAEQKKAVALEKKAAGQLNGAGQTSLVDESNAGLTTWIALACLCDENREFLCKSVVDISQACDSLAGKKGAPIARIAAKAQEVNAVGQAELEAIEKN